MGRAWVFQEYYLSQRFVCISNIGMWFECRTVVPENDLGDVVLWRENRMPRRGDMAYGTKLFIERHDADTSNWTDLASRYSGLALTKPSDRIAALLASRQTMPHQIRLSQHVYILVWNLAARVAAKSHVGAIRAHRRRCWTKGGGNAYGVLGISYGTGQLERGEELSRVFSSRRTRGSFRDSVSRCQKSG